MNCFRFLGLAAASLFTVSILAFTFSPTSAARAKIDPNLPNFGTVDPGIYRGAAPTLVGLQELKAMGVQTVIDLRISPKHVAQERKEATGMGLSFINLPMGSDPPTPKEQQILMAAFSTAQAHPVYVHCQYGADRTGAMVGMWREKHDNWGYTQTYKEMRHYGFKPYLKKLAAFVQSCARS